jgi:transposase InsO family protein
MHPGEIAELDLLRGVADRLHKAAHGSREAVVLDACRMLGCKRGALYTKLRKVGWCSGRALRADKGDCRVTEAEVRAVSAIMMASRRMTGKILLPVCDAIDIALANSKLTERVAPSTMLRLMRKFDCHPTQLQRPTSHVGMASLHPNHVWQLDASVCVLYRLKNGRTKVLDERTFNARKPADLAKILNERLLRYAITDHTTGVVIARYYVAAGEDQRTLFDFLMWAFHPQTGRVMHGVPWMLVWDAGSANQSHAIRNLLTALGIRHWAHVPGNSRAKGQVERMHDIVERKFEGRLSFLNVESVEQLNAELDVFLISFNGVAKLTRGTHQHVRNALWQTIRPEQLRLCPPVETCAVLMHSKPELRTVTGNLTITFKPRNSVRHTYSVADVPAVRSGEQVAVAINPYCSPAIFVIAQDESGSTRYFECEPLEINEAGFIHGSPVFGESYAAHADSDVDIARKQANLAAYGERDGGDALAAKAKGRVAFAGQIDPFKDLREKAAATPHFMRRGGTDLDLPNPMHVEPRHHSMVDLLFALRRRLGDRFGARESEAVQVWHPDGLPDDQLETLFERLEQLDAAGTPPATAAPRLVAVR